MRIGRSLLSSALLLTAMTIDAQAPAAQNAAEAVRAQYRYPRELPGFELIGDTADPSPGFGVAIQWVSPDHRDVRLDVFLYRMHKARLPNVALREAAERYQSELELSYRDTPIESGEFRTITWSPKPFDSATEHSFSFESKGKRTHSHTLLFYDQGHHLKFRASGAGKDAVELMQLTRKLAHGFLARFEVAQAYGHRCGPPAVVEVDADDPRVGSANTTGSEFYVPRGGNRQDIGQMVGNMMLQSVVASSKAGCIGDGVRAKLGED